MAYNNYRNNDKRDNFNKRDNFHGDNRKPYGHNDHKPAKFDRPKKEIMTFPLINKFSVKLSQNEVELPYNEIVEILFDLCDVGAFEKLTQNVTVSRPTLMGDETKKGNAVVGFINQFFTEDSGDVAVEVTVYGTSVEPVKNLMNKGALYLSPKFITSFDGKFKCFNGFELISK